MQNNHQDVKFEIKTLSTFYKSKKELLNSNKH